MSKQTWKGSTLLGPIPPTMVSCGTVDQPNVLTVAWTGIINTIPPKTYISLRPERFSYDLIKNSGDFVINLTTKDLVFAADFCGVRSGKTIDKFKEMNLTPEQASQVTSPMIAQSPVSLECKVTQIIPLGSHDMFLADIVAVNVDEKLLDVTGKLCLDKGDLVAFAHGEYFALGASLGTFGYSVRKKPVETHCATPTTPANKQPISTIPVATTPKKPRRRTLDKQKPTTNKGSKKNKR